MKSLESSPTRFHEAVFYTGYGQKIRDVSFVLESIKYNLNKESLHESERKLLEQQKNYLTDELAFLQDIGNQLQWHPTPRGCRVSCSLKKNQVRLGISVNFENHRTRYYVDEKEIPLKNAMSVRSHLEVMRELAYSTGLHHLRSKNI